MAGIYTNFGYPQAGYPHLPLRRSFGQHDRMAEETDPLLLRRNLIRTGSTDNDIRSAKSAGSITSLRRGAFASTAALATMRAEDKHLLTVRAHLSAARSDLVVSHQSAAVVHGFAMWSPDLTRVHVTTDRTAGGRTTRNSHVHAAPLTDDDVTVVNGIAVTSADRTVADLLRILRFEAGVCVGDAALHSGSATVEGVTAALERSVGRGVVNARRTLAFCDSRSESVGESRTRVLLHRLNIPLPELQVNLYSESGPFLGRVDFLFLIGVILEFDGDVKYMKHLKPGQTPADAVIAEKLREDEIRSLGWVFVRCKWSELAHPDRFLAKLQRAFELAASLPTPRTVTRP